MPCVVHAQTLLSTYKQMPVRSRNTSTEILNPFPPLKVRRVLCFLGPKMPGLTIGDTIPNLEVNTTHGKFKIHDFVDDGWAIIFSHPGDFTPICTTELAKMAQYQEEFEKRGVMLSGLSCDNLQSHTEWIKDIEAFAGSGCKVRYQIVADPNREIIKQLNMVYPDEKDSNGNPIPSRALHIVGPDKK